MKTIYKLIGITMAIFFTGLCIYGIRILPIYQAKDEIQISSFIAAGRVASRALDCRSEKQS